MKNLLELAKKTYEGNCDNEKIKEEIYKFLSDVTQDAARKGKPKVEMAERSLPDVIKNNLVLTRKIITEEKLGRIDWTPNGIISLRLSGWSKEEFTDDRLTYHDELLKQYLEEVWGIFFKKV